MPKFACKCSFVMNLSDGNPSYELKLVPEYKIQEIGDLLDASEKLTADIFYASIDEVSTTVYRCTNCERLYVESKKNVFIMYEPDKSKRA